MTLDPRILVSFSQEGAQNIAHKVAGQRTWHDAGWYALGLSIQMVLPVALCELFTLRHGAFSSCLLQQLLPNLF